MQLNNDPQASDEGGSAATRRRCPASGTGNLLNCRGDEHVVKRGQIVPPRPFLHYTPSFLLTFISAFFARSAGGAFRGIPVNVGENDYHIRCNCDVAAVFNGRATA